jgi:hypothetical protein
METEPPDWPTIEQLRETCGPLLRQAEFLGWTLANLSAALDSPQAYPLVKRCQAADLRGEEIIKAFMKAVVKGEFDQFLSADGQSLS